MNMIRIWMLLFMLFRNWNQLVLLNGAHCLSVRVSIASTFIILHHKASLGRRLWNKNINNFLTIRSFLLKAVSYRQKWKCPSQIGMKFGTPPGLRDFVINWKSKILDLSTSGYQAGYLGSSSSWKNIINDFGNI
jgi:hypothetical protein